MLTDLLAGSLADAAARREALPLAELE
ncbi:indole-3-glycerol-phosphate synthase TrpC, partial [Leucobacter sp. M11]|nr:indole-3-glycerol-phosphate synthase TrpC [Leucobacter sp. M11]